MRTLEDAVFSEEGDGLRVSVGSEEPVSVEVLADRLREQLPEFWGPTNKRAARRESLSPIDQVIEDLKLRR